MWEERIRAVMQLFITASSHYRDNNVVLEAVAIPCLSRLLSVIELVELGQAGPSLKEGLRTVVRSQEAEIFTSLRDWLRASPQHSFGNWYRLQRTRALQSPAIKETPAVAPAAAVKSAAGGGGGGGGRRPVGRGEKGQKAAVEKRRTGGEAKDGGHEAVRRRYLEVRRRDALTVERIFRICLVVTGVRIAINHFYCVE